MRKIMKKTFMVLFVLVTIVVQTTCAHLSKIFREPVVTLDSVKFTTITLNGAELLCKIKVRNTNPIDIPFPRIDWKLFINTNEFIKGSIVKNNALKANRSTFVDVPVSLNYVEAFNSIKSLVGTKEAGYRIELATKFTLPIFGDRVWNFTHQGVFPVLQLPKLSRPSFKVDKLDFTKAELVFSIDVENPNKFDLPMPKMEYDYKVNNNSFIKSSVVVGSVLAAAAVTPVFIRLSVDYPELFRNFQSLRNLNEVPSILSIKSDFKIPAFPNNPTIADQTVSLPLIKVPTLSFGGIRVKNLSPTNIDFEINWEVENNNSFAMNVKNLNFNFAVNNSTWVNGKVPGSPQIPANRKTSIPFTFSINNLTMVKDITAIISQGRNINYTCGGNLNLGTSLPGLGDFGTPFNYTGTSKLSR